MYPNKSIRKHMGTENKVWILHRYNTVSGCCYRRITHYHEDVILTMIYLLREFHVAT